MTTRQPDAQEQICMRFLVRQTSGLMRRRLAGFFAVQHGRGTIQVVSNCTGLGYKRVRLGILDLQNINDDNEINWQLY